MKTIYKYAVSPEFELELPLDAQVLSVQTQYHQPQMWVLVDTDKPKVSRFFRFYGTGHDLGNNPGAYIGTFQCEDGRLVFHLFEQVLLSAD